MHVKLSIWTLHGILVFMRHMQYIFIAAGILIAQCYFTLTTHHFVNSEFREVTWIQVRTVNPISQEFHAEQLAFQQLPPLPSTKLTFIEGLSDKPSKPTLLNTTLSFTS